ncbi:something about silencing protein 10 [Mitosporidium daphniae]|uniref:Sas10 C-terminal domain-containing protein n=1 Tax=Mitosporidium daphniae TaxID=1485682 RepID=A0A098VQL5_9MICR|nr:uncharacterized protein DI09_93p20 [Mitosporidium daphniae]KGG50016.1 hypothetical protein DI09_93p20 [Mitosporidium daphniae]|eukprot:XP_013236452.1 uncharacterized protein DI09_93p20 [Mitosporidium daphniae]
MAKNGKAGGHFSDLSDDEVDKFHHSRDKILFEDSKNTSAVLEYEDAPFLNEQDVLPLDPSSDEFSEDTLLNEEYYLNSDIKAWGRKKKIFYSSDKNAEKEELLECIRVQRLKRASLRLCDYYFPGLADQKLYYQNIQYYEAPTCFPYYKNGRIVENSKNLYFVSKANQVPKSCSKDRQSSGSEREDESLSQSELEDDLYSSCETEGECGLDHQDEYANKINKRDVNSDEEYYEAIKSLKAAKKEKNPNCSYSGPSYDRYNDMDAGSKRTIPYEILKNKGLLPVRSKEQRNPRVKQRKRYERAMKKIKGFKPMVAPKMHGAPYAGERSGIRTNIVKSTKFTR